MSPFHDCCSRKPAQSRITNKTWIETKIIYYEENLTFIILKKYSKQNKTGEIDQDNKLIKHNVFVVDSN